MILQYDSELKEWSHEAGADKDISFGFNKTRVPPAKDSSLPETNHRFPLNDLNGNAGPLIGIMTAMNKKMALAGNGHLFQALQSEVMKRDGMTVVFTPETLFKDSITGVAYLPDLERWLPIKTPLPHLVFNRVPFRKTEKLPSFNDAVNYLAALGIPFFNPAFINKNKLYSLFSSHPRLKDLMPVTIPVKSMDQLASFLEEHRGIYLKPASSAKGTGIFRLRFKNNIIEFASHSHQHNYPSIKNFWKVKARQLLKHEYIAQKEILPAVIGGNRFDFRVHAHDGKDGYEVTGIGIRQSQKQDLTTHLPNGGVMQPYLHFRNEKHDQFFARIVQEIGTLLTEEWGYFGEFSIDAGISDSGNYVIYEVNSKPMSFDEPHIEEYRFSALADLFFRKAGF